jgi:hypothetical protein
VLAVLHVVESIELDGTEAGQGHDWVGVATRPGDGTAADGTERVQHVRHVRTDRLRECRCTASGRTCRDVGREPLTSRTENEAA